jgi:3-hydroxybutyryl-CoA dehydratase
MAGCKVKIGETASISKHFKAIEVVQFSDITGDSNPIHTDEQYAKKSFFKEPIVQGMFIGSLISSVLGTKLPGPGCIYLKQDMVFLHPVKIGDII